MLKFAYELGVQQAFKEASERGVAERAIRATPDQAQRFSGLNRRLAGMGGGAMAGGSLGAVGGALLSKMLDLDDDTRNRLMLGLGGAGLLGGGYWGAKHPGAAGAVGGTIAGGYAGGGLGGVLGGALGGLDNHVPIGVGAGLGGLAGAIGGGMLGYEGLRE